MVVRIANSDARDLIPAIRGAGEYRGQGGAEIADHFEKRMREVVVLVAPEQWYAARDSTAMGMKLCGDAGPIERRDPVGHDGRARARQTGQRRLRYGLAGEGPT